MSFENVEVAKVREYWDRRPCNIGHSPRPVGSKEYFDEVEARKYFVEPHIPRFAEFERWRGRRVLEVGCGIGTDTIRFARHGANVTAVDLSAKSIEVARRRADIYGLSGQIDFFCGDAEELSRFVPAEPYDLIYSFGVIHHTPRPGRVLEQARRYTRRGTTLKIMVYHRRSWKVARILFGEGKGQFWKLSTLVARNSEAQTGCPITYTYTRKEGKGLVEEHGFRVREMFVDHIFCYRIPEYVQYRYVREAQFAWMPPGFFRGLEKRLGWHLCITAETAA